MGPPVGHHDTDGPVPALAAALLGGPANVREVRRTYVLTNYWTILVVSRPYSRGSLYFGWVAAK